MRIILNILPLIAISTTALAGKAVPSKRGLAYNGTVSVDGFKDYEFTWGYSWGPKRGPASESIVKQFVPMIWTDPQDDASVTAATDAFKALGDEKSYVLSFNEPDLPQQANVPFQKAADDWKSKFMPAIGKNTSSVSPAVTSSEAQGQGLDWLDEFLSACDDCNFEAVAAHWYGDTNIPDGVADTFLKHVNDTVALAKKHKIDKVWITEFGFLDGGSDSNAQKRVDFLKQVMPKLDSNSAVERYSYYFMKLFNDGKISADDDEVVAYVAGSDSDSDPDSTTSASADSTFESESATDSSSENTSTSTPEESDTSSSSSETTPTSSPDEDSSSSSSSEEGSSSSSEATTSTSSPEDSSASSSEETTSTPTSTSEGDSDSASEETTSTSSDDISELAQEKAIPTSSSDGSSSSSTEDTPTAIPEQTVTIGIHQVQNFHLPADFLIQADQVAPGGSPDDVYLIQCDVAGN